MTAWITAGECSTTSTAQASPTDVPHLTWSDVEPLYQDLQERALSAETVDAFLADWGALRGQVDEMGTRLWVNTTRNTADEALSARYRDFLEGVQPAWEAAEQELRRKLLASDLTPPGLEVPLRSLHAESALFREENLPLLSREALLVERYFQVLGAQTVEWEGKEIPVAQLQPVQEDPDRDRREKAFRAGLERRRQDDAALDGVWRELLAVRHEIAANAGFDDFRSYRWVKLNRFDYTPDDCKRFNQAVEEVVVPVVARMMERRRRQLGVEMLRPWDLDVDPWGRPPLRPYDEPEELEDRATAIFRQVDPQFGEYFTTMRQEGLLDLHSRENKAPGGYCSTFAAQWRPFIFANATRTRTDVEGLMHEGGHAFHVFERASLPHRIFAPPPVEFAEVASMSMELLAGPFLTRDAGGFYSAEDAVRARLGHLSQQVLLVWAGIALRDAFQHWIYEHSEEAAETARVSAVWRELSERFLPGIDWTGLTGEQAGSWRDVLHFFMAPLYTIEYAFAQLGAVQIWAHSRRDYRDAVLHYRSALALGGSRPLPELYAAAGARFAFDRDTLRQAVEVVEVEIERLEDIVRRGRAVRR